MGQNEVVFDAAMDYNELDWVMWHPKVMAWLIARLEGVAQPVGP